MKNDKKNLILQAACAAFTESGYEKSSIESISRRAGVAQGLARYHFVNKETLYFNALSFVMTGLRNQLQSDVGALSLDKSEATKKFVRSYMAFTSDASTGYAMVYREPPFVMLSNPEHMSALSSLSQEIVQILARKLSTNNDPEAAFRMAAYVVTSLHGVQRARFSPVYKALVDIDELADFFAGAVQSLSGEDCKDRISAHAILSNPVRGCI
jgi:AcrR family transcriptional regulator